MSRSAPLGAPGEARSVLANKPFRRLWISLSLSSLGDWLSLLALMSLATILTRGEGAAAQYFAVSGVVALKLAPPILLSPFAGLLADRVDRRLTMVVADVLRAALYISIPIVGELWWLLVANLLAEIVALFWAPAKDATVPNLVPKAKLEQANQLSLLTTYGTAPVAAALFAALASVSSLLSGLFPGMGSPAADIALYVNGVTFLVAAAVVWTLPIPKRTAARRTPEAPAGPLGDPHAPTAPIPDPNARTAPIPDPNARTAPIPDPNARTAPIPAAGDPDAATLEVPVVPEPGAAPSTPAQGAPPQAAPGAPAQGAPAAPAAPAAARPAPERARPENVLRTIWEGWRFAGTTPLVRGVLLGMLGAFAAGGAVVGVARVFVERLGAGNAGFGVLFCAVFAGMALGMLAGPRVLRDFSRRRLFGLSIGVSGVALLFAGLIPNMVLAAVLTAVVGLGAGIAWVIGLTLLGQEVEDDMRGRTFAFLHAAGRVVLLVSVSVAPLVAALIGDHRLRLRGLTYDVLGTGMVLVLAALLAILVAFVAYRQMSDHPDVPLFTELVAALRGVPVAAEAAEERLPGTFIALEGGEGAGKSTQAGQLAVWLREEGFEVVTTREPGATKLGMRLRALLLDKENTGMSSRAETLLYAADRADHVGSVILPALRRGAIVVTDRYVDSTLAYQGAGRELPVAEIERVNAWATDGLTPDLTVLLDLPPEDGLARLGGGTDRIEAESVEFHGRVRKGFRELAERAPERYLVLDAREPQERILREIQRRVRPLLPDPVPQDAEAITGMMPIIKE
ncbi:dTMP kinase [Nocardiopsis trehalosi]|uniref:dTMP kinase n=1 Tax=Nocardiopsis trehalosi TaxID=109329 RepID=UPI000830845E|nr:dTMP kinase [Nocardiopsis trehalosi]